MKTLILSLSLSLFMSLSPSYYDTVAVDAAVIAAALQKPSLSSSPLFPVCLSVCLSLFLSSNYFGSTKPTLEVRHRKIVSFNQLHRRIIKSFRWIDNFSTFASLSLSLSLSHPLSLCFLTLTNTCTLSLSSIHCKRQARVDEWAVPQITSYRVNIWLPFGPDYANRLEQ